MSLLQITLQASENLSLEPGNSQSLVFTQLLNKLGDNNPRVREKADEILFSMAQHKCFGTERVCANIMKSVAGQKNSVQASSLKHTIGRY